MDNNKEKNSINSGGDITIGPSDPIGYITAFSHEYISPVGDDEFPILASTAFYPTLTVNQEGKEMWEFKNDFDSVRKCGFNMIDSWMTFGREDNKKLAELAKAAGLRIQAGNWDYFNSVVAVSDFLDDCKDIDTITLWKFKDEPDLKMIGLYHNSYKSLYHEDGNKRMVVTNLLGGMVGKTFDKKIVNIDGENTLVDATLEESLYFNYVDEFEKKFGPGVFSYDAYPIQENAWGIYMDDSAYQGFYGNLIFYACKSYDHVEGNVRYRGRKFWAYVETLTMRAYNENNVLCRRFPKAKEEYIRFEAFNALAFGAQGILYWTYGDREPIRDEVYFGGLMDASGYRTEAWYAAQKVNREIHALKDVFLNCHLLEFWFTSKKPDSSTPSQGKPRFINDYVEKFMYGNNIKNTNDTSTIYVKDDNGVKDANSPGIVTTKIKKTTNTNEGTITKYYKIFLNQDYQEDTDVTFTVCSDIDSSTIYRILPNVELAARKFEMPENMGINIKPMRIPLESGQPFDYTIPPGGYVIFEVPETTDK